ncbi:MAG: hypothetical protein MK108_09710 [Mariniblastus sp.]|nr:hypothetical protein [Mariniblastus sp.]
MLINVTTKQEKQETDSDNHRKLIGQLRKKINKTEASLRNHDGTPVSSGSPDIDQSLPSGGIPRGTLTEWFVDQPGNSGEFLSLLVASRALSGGGALVIADPCRRFYPPAAALLGIELADLVVLRPERTMVPHHSGGSGFQCDDLFWAVDQALRSTAVAAVWGCFSGIHERWFRRFQLSAESSGCLGLFVRPAWTRRQPSWAETQWKIRTRPGPHDLPWRRVSLKLLRCRTGRSGKTVSLNINTVTGSVQRARNEHDHQNRGQARALSLATQLAHPAIGRRSARA